MNAKKNTDFLLERRRDANRYFEHTHEGARALVSWQPDLDTLTYIQVSILFLLYFSPSSGL
jgi:hypothetical protein